MKLEKSKIEEAKSVDLVSLLDRYGVTMQKQGAEFFGLCPFHTETTPSFNVTPRVNLFKCFGCGESGDPIEFIKKYLGVGFVDAVKIINNDATGPDATIQKRDRVKIPEKPKFETAQVPDNAPAPKEFKWLRAPAGFEVPSSYKTFTGKDGAVLVKHIAVKHWEYRDADGKLLGYVTRFNQAWGGKQTLPQTWCVDSKTGELGWQWQAFPEPRPLYGLDLLAANPDAQVMVVEGEKACDSARVLAASLRITAAQLVIVSWPGGCQSVSRADWSPLYGRRVALWPDADQKPYPENHERAGELMPFEEQPGTDAMRSVYRLLAEHCETVKLIMPPAGVPDGWDLADELPAGFHFIKHLKESSRPAAEVFPDAARVPVAEATDAETVPEHDEYLQSMMVRLDPAEAAQHQMVEDHQVPSSGEDELTENGYFRVLGFDHDRYFFMQYEKRQIMVYSKGDFSESGLIELAPLEFWETYFAGESTKIDKRAAMNWIIRLAHLRGIYDTSRLRGRGAWVDAGRYVYHHGSHLTVDGERYDIRDFKTRFAYEMSRSLPDISDDPLTNEEGRDIVELSEMFRWSKPASAPLLAGWIALAPICGALRWRPHIWVSGGPGSGKAQPHDSKVLTPSGWTTMGEIRVGDLVTTPDNSFARVLGVYPQGVIPVYKLTFADGRTVRASGDHLWKVRIKREWRLRTTEQMIEILQRESGESSKLAIPLSDAVEITAGKRVELPVHPYVLGALIGDGSMGGSSGTDSICFTSADPEVANRVSLLSPENMALVKAGDSTEITFRFKRLDAYGKSMRSLVKELRLLGKSSADKFIPQAYLDASIADRWELLKGLMDTDGTAGQAGSMSYCTISEQLANDVVYLVRSLGGIASIATKTPTYTYNDEKRTGKLSYVVSIRFANRQNVFHLGRKLERVSEEHQYSDCMYLNVTSIERDGEEECSCISVDHPDRLYVTDNFVVTHNTTVLNRFVNPLMNGMGVFVQGNSTEAGIRQYLKCDALPVLFDESESNTDREAVRIQNVLSMIRQASSESQALTLKGTAGGDAMSFHIRSMFCLSSIQVGIKYQADIERVTVLNLQPKRDEANASEKWKEMDSLLYSLERDAKLSPRLVARSINLLPKTLKNIVTFAEAGAIKFGSQRDGDQYGTLMAGAYSLMSDDLVTLDGALAMLDSYDWSEHREGAESDEGERAMGALMQALIRIAGVEISVNELIRVACNVHVEGCSYSDPSNAAAVLERYGMRIDQVENVLILQNNSKNLQELMAGTPFETDLRGVMLRVRGAAKYRKPIKFGGVLSRAVTVPLSPLLNDDAVAELTNGQKVTF